RVLSFREVASPSSLRKRVLSFREVASPSSFRKRVLPFRAVASPLSLRERARVRVLKKKHATILTFAAIPRQFL
ncbi:MAG: hypothetical protein AB1733_00950, partial [Thermodesulfobacteriota bacterium]